MTGKRSSSNVRLNIPKWSNSLQSNAVVINAQSSTEVQEFSFSKWLGFWLFLFLLMMIAFATELLAVKSLLEHGPACGPRHEYGGFRDGWMEYMEHFRPKRVDKPSDIRHFLTLSCNFRRSNLDYHARE